MSVPPTSKGVVEFEDAADETARGQELEARTVGGTTAGERGFWLIWGLRKMQLPGVTNTWHPSQYSHILEMFLIWHRETNFNERLKVSHKAKLWSVQPERRPWSQVSTSLQGTSYNHSPMSCSCLTFCISVPWSIYCCFWGGLAGGVRSPLNLHAHAAAIKQTTANHNEQKVVCLQKRIQWQKICLRNLPNSLLLGGHSWPNLDQQNRGLDPKINQGVAADNVLYI